MSTLLTVYFILLLASLAYFALNVVHLLRFRLGFPGDRTQTAIAIYALAFIFILGISWLVALALSGI